MAVIITSICNQITIDFDVVQLYSRSGRNPFSFFPSFFSILGCTTILYHGKFERFYWEKKKPIWSVRLKSGSPLCAEEALIASPPARGKSLSLASLLLLLAYAGCWYEGSPVDRAEFSACMVQCGRCYSLGSETGHPLDIGR